MSKNSLGDIWNLRYPARSLRPAVLPIGINGGETQESRTNGLINVQYEKFANFVHEYRLFIEVKLFPGKRSGPFSFDKLSKAENHKAEHHGPPFSKTRVINVSRYTINSWQAYL